MQKNLRFGILLLAVAFSMACEEADKDSSVGNMEEHSASVQHPSGTLNGEYFFMTRDMRKCMYPMCGGYFLSAVNRPRMRCLDGTIQKSCYVAEADFAGLNLPDSDFSKLFSRANGKLVVFHGTVESNVVGDFGDYGRLVVDKAFSAVTDEEPSIWSPLYLAYDNGIRCIKAPCPSLDDVRLNYENSRRSIIGVDFGGVIGATQEQLEAASQALFESGVIVAGYHSVDWNFFPRRNYELVAEQIYLPVKASNNDPLYCENDADCVMTQYKKPVSSPNECYCTLCPTLLTNTWTAGEFEAGWLEHCTELTEPNRCPLPHCRKPDTYPACEKNTCVLRSEGEL
jgi:hypothetical protein